MARVKMTSSEDLKRGPQDGPPKIVLEAMSSLSSRQRTQLVAWLTRQGSDGEGSVRPGHTTKMEMPQPIQPDPTTLPLNAEIVLRVRQNNIEMPGPADIKANKSLSFSVMAELFDKAGATMKLMALSASYYVPRQDNHGD